MPLGPSGFVSDLEFDGTSLQRGRTLVMQITRGLLGAPTVRGRDTVIPQAAGQTPRSRQADRLPIELAGWILAEDPEEYWELVAELNTLFDGVMAAPIGHLAAFSHEHPARALPAMEIRTATPAKKP